MGLVRPVRWWRDDATRYATRGAQVVPHAQALASANIQLWEPPPGGPDPIADIRALIERINLEIARSLGIPGLEEHVRGGR